MNMFQFIITSRTKKEETKTPMGYTVDPRVIRLTHIKAIFKLNVITK